MIRGITVKALDSAVGVQIPPPPMQDFWFVEDELVVLIGDLVEGHGPPPHSPPPQMVTGSDWMTINGIPVCRRGDLAACGHETTGRPWWKIT